MSRTKLRQRRPANLTQYAQPYRQALATFEAFRKLDFSADEIFFGFGPVSGTADMVHMQLQTQGKTFTVMCGVLRGASRSSVIKTWSQITTRIPSEKQEHLDQIWRESVYAETSYFVVFASMIVDKGIVLPALPEMSRGRAAGSA